MKIINFLEENLADALSNDYTSKEAIKDKNHFKYLLGYLKEIGVKTIVIEEEYVSKDYLHDYSSYYSLCFTRFPKFCKRVHFFGLEFDKDTFTTFITSGTGSVDLDIKGSYIGFVVVKPIPHTVIGFSLLKTYSNSSQFNDRNFWGLKTFPVHLFGTEFEIESLAFQEQDSVLAACATTAIWSMLSKATNFSLLKPPSQITKDAGNISFDGSRLFPNKGLNILQICEAIYQSGFVSEVKQPDLIIEDIKSNEVFIEDTGSTQLEEEKEIIEVITSLYLKKILNAYSPIGIPLILVISVPNGGEHGLHAITVSGFKQKEPTLIPPSEEIRFQAENIEKFYAHDDQWGPFVRIGFLDDYRIDTPWSSDSKDAAMVTNIIVPLRPKIRIAYEDIEDIVSGLDTILTLFFESKIVHDLIWDIKIDFSQNFKNYIKESLNDLGELDIKIEYLTKNYPRYIWTVKCYVGKNVALVFIFDATGVSQGMLGLEIVSHLPEEVKNKLIDFLEENKGTDLEGIFNHPAGHDYYQFLIEKIKSPL